MKNIKKIIKYFKILSSRPVPEQKKLDFDKKELSYIYNQFYITTGQDQQHNKSENYNNNNQ